MEKKEKQFKPTGTERVEAMMADRPKKTVTNDVGEIIYMDDDLVEAIFKGPFLEDPKDVSRAFQEAMDELVEWRDGDAPNSIEFKNVYANLKFFRDIFGKCRFTKTSVQ